MSQSVTFGLERQARNHFLVFAYDVKISPLILNDYQSSFEIFTCTSIKELVGCFQSKRPGCLVINADNEFFDHPNINPMSRLLPMVMVTHTSSIVAVASATKKGAHTVLRDLSNPDLVRDAVHAACLADCRGELSPYSIRLKLDTLTTKERQVVYMSLRAKSTKMISTELNVCHQTVDKHKKRALSKLQAGCMVELYNLLLDSHRLAAGMAIHSATHRIASPHTSPPRANPVPKPRTVRGTA